MKNLLLVANYRPDVGYAWWLMERFWVLLAEEAARSGRRTLLAYPETGIVPASIVASPIEVVTLSVPTSGKVGPDVTGFLREQQVAAMYFTDRPYRSLAYLQYRRAGVNAIVTHDHTPGDRPRTGGMRGAIKAMVNRLPLITADRVIALSPLMRARAIENGRVPADRVTVVTNGIDPIDGPSNDRGTLRAELGLRADDIALVSVGRAHRYKGVHRILEAVATARRNGARNLVFVHIGDGPHLEEFHQQAERLSLHDGACRFLGARKDATRLLPAFDMAIHASDGEGFSLSILEYMRAGLATIVSDQPSVAQAITHEVTGLIFRRDDPGAAAACMQELANNPKRRQALGRTGQQSVADQYSWARTVTEFAPCAQWIISSCR